MATTGYITASNDGATSFSHTQSRLAFYTASSGKWHGVFQDDTGADWKGWKWDGTNPASPGDTSTGWSVIAAINPSTADTSTTVLHWDETNQELHVVKLHATEFYQKYTYTAGTDSWAQDVTDEDVGVTLLADQTDIAVDSSQRPWIAYVSATGTLETRVRVSGTWGNGAQLSAATDVVAVNVIPYTDASGNAGLYCVWVETAGGIKAAHRLDSAGTATSWTADASIPAGIGNDNHISTVSVILSGDTGSTILCSNKDTSNNTACARRDPDGTWSSAVSVAASRGRIKLVVDETNEDVYAIGNSDGAGAAIAIEYRSSPINSLSFSSATTVLEDTGVTQDFSFCSVPSHNCTGTTNILVLGSNSGVWYNTIELAGGAVSASQASMSSPSMRRRIRAVRG